MRPISRLIDAARSAFPSACDLQYLHPTLYLICSDPDFGPLGEDARKARFLEKTDLPTEALDELSLSSNVLLYLVTPEEREHDLAFLDSGSGGSHWLPLFDPKALLARTADESPTPRAIHFYGYKGGQARSTVLGMLAQQLANDGYRVLVVDSDLEAPSLHILFGAAASDPNSTLLGLSAPDSRLQTIAAYTPAESAGRVDLIACRPDSREYDMDFAAFVLRCTLDVMVLEETVRKLREEVAAAPEQERYDFVLFDHRSGLASSVLPVLTAYPGPTVICLRLDDQSSGAFSMFDILLGRTRDYPGAFVSFSLDPEDTHEKAATRWSERIDTLLDHLGAAMERGIVQDTLSDVDAGLSPDEIRRFWVPWFHDRIFLSTALPPVEKITKDNLTSLAQLREVLGLAGRRPSPVPHTPATTNAHLDPSGARDEGVFIETEGIRLLFQPNTHIRYIFGRKGTGKTRLLRELARRPAGDRSLGEPLIVSGDEQDAGGLPVGVLFKDLADAFVDRQEHLWWAILNAALEVEDTAGQRGEFQERLKRFLQPGVSLSRGDVAKIAEQQRRRRVFLVDGLETGFVPDRLLGFIASLFDFLATVQNDPAFAQVTIRLFLRTDLYKRAAGQNAEQQTANRRLDLEWDAQSIFNFVLSRIPRLPWFQTHFTDVCADIETQQDQIRRGLLTREEYQPLLLRIFPERLRRNNLQTLTFLNAYFSDAAGDNESRASFYPRLFDAFLHRLVVGNPDPATALENGRLHQRRILDAHEEASADFLNEIRQELHLLLDLSPNTDVNRALVDNLVAAFTGLQTPFRLDACLLELAERLNAIPSEAAEAAPVSAERLRTALQRMKEIGMFEDRPSSPGEWRVGRLFKTALKMKYVRK